MMNLKKIMKFLRHTRKPKPIPQIMELSSFKDINAVWRPNDNKLGVILRWFMTEWCNYNCPYCAQEHIRNRFKGSFSVHCFDNYTPEEWMNSIDRHFKDKRVALILTGGEPMLDLKNMRNFLSMILTKSYIDNIRIDTNMAWKPHHFKNLPNKEKLIFNCSLHTSQTKIDDFTFRVKRLEKLDFKIGMINYVMNPEQTSHYEELMIKFKEINLLLHPNPLWDYKHSEELEKSLKIALDDIDIFYKTVGKTKGKVCYYPSIAYEMNQNGDVGVGCYLWISRNIFKNGIPKLPEAPIKCPHNYCKCLDKYSFIKGINRNIELNTLKIYGNLIRKHLGLPFII